MHGNASHTTNEYKPMQCNARQQRQSKIQTIKHSNYLDNTEDLDDMILTRKEFPGRDFVETAFDE